MLTITPKEQKGVHLSNKLRKEDPTNIIRSPLDKLENKKASQELNGYINEVRNISSP
jgi:hypothetical protein